MIPDDYKTKEKDKIPVCSYLWRRMLCRRPKCWARHPDLCANNAGLPSRNPNCDKFHGQF